MTVTLLTIPCLSDNYAYLLHNDQTGQTALVDAPEAGPVRDALAARGWGLDQIFLTHHHWDHVDALEDLRGAAEVIGAAADAHRLPPLDRAVAGGDQIAFAGEDAQVMDVPGHTIGHLALHLPGPGFVFTADSLMAMGCGRLFEGTPAQMLDSLTRLAALPGDTVVCSGHEYTATNIAFARDLEPENPDVAARAAEVEALRQTGQPTVPSRLVQERATNPFLRASDPVLGRAIGMDGASPLEVFTQVRARRDSW